MWRIGPRPLTQVFSKSARLASPREKETQRLGCGEPAATRSHLDRLGEPDAIARRMVT
ncbi:hypothetical protein [Rosistilla oblonga]|uniref:hypothetical protein n=1 Tax=Rosistilla oblonga TaxID=2527990 RepID=UPI003A96C0C3